MSYGTTIPKFYQYHPAGRHNVVHRRPAYLFGNCKKMEPALLLPMGFGAILMNLPIAEEGTGVQAVIDFLFLIGIDSHELFPLLLFIGIGAMIDFEPLLTNPKLMLFGAAAQFGIFLRCLPQACSVSSLKTRRPLQSSERQTVLPPFMSPAC